MSPVTNSSRQTESSCGHAPRASAVARLRGVFVLALVVSAALTGLYANAQKPLEGLAQKTVIPQQTLRPRLIAKPSVVSLCPNLPTRVTLFARVPARGDSHWETFNVGVIVAAKGSIAVWDLSGVKAGRYTVVYTRTSDLKQASAAVKLSTDVEVLDCAKPTPTPTPISTPTQTPTPFPTHTPRGNDNTFVGALTPTPFGPTPTPTPSPSASPSTSPTAPAESSSRSWLSWLWYGILFLLAGLVMLIIGGSLRMSGGLLNVSYLEMISQYIRGVARSTFNLNKAGTGADASNLPGGQAEAGTSEGAVAEVGDADKAETDFEVEEESVEAAKETTGVHTGGVKDSDEVHCTVFSPLKASPGDSLLVQVFAHLASQFIEVANMAGDADADAKQRDSVELDERIEQGQELVFELSMRGLEVREPTTMRLVWKGKPKSVKFDVYVPEDFEPKSVTGSVDVYYLSVPIGNLRFKLDIVSRGEAVAKRPMFPEQDFKRYRYAFISYASEDRAEVLRRVQVLPLVSIDYFQDITSLDPGDRWARKLYTEIDRSDVFFLFWSKAARNSEWVEKEVLYAIGRKHGDDAAAPDIKPVILEGPPPVEPPESLRSLHFNDKTLYFISVEDSLRAARERKTRGEDEKDG